MQARVLRPTFQQVPRQKHTGIFGGTLRDGKYGIWMYSPRGMWWIVADYEDIPVGATHIRRRQTVQ